jgi:hypothetical protein
MANTVGRTNSRVIALWVSQQHGVNIEWLLEGRGRIFEKDPITLNPNMTGSEFAAVVTTLPMADQQVITTMVREILREKLDEPA